MIGRAPVLLRVPVISDLLSVLKRSGIVMCPMASDTSSDSVTTCPAALDSSFGVEGLRCHHVPCVTGSATRQETAPVSPRVPRLQTRFPMWEGSDVTTCPMTPDPPPCKKGTRCHHIILMPNKKEINK
jgi:hypothetical protein